MRLGRVAGYWLLITWLLSGLGLAGFYLLRAEPEEISVQGAAVMMLIAPLTLFWALLGAADGIPGWVAWTVLLLSFGAAYASDRHHTRKAPTASQMLQWIGWIWVPCLLLSCWNMALAFGAEDGTRAFGKGLFYAGAFLTFLDVSGKTFPITSRLGKICCGFLVSVSVVALYAVMLVSVTGAWGAGLGAPGVAPGDVFFFFVGVILVVRDGFRAAEEQRAVA